MWPFFLALKNRLPQTWCKAKGEITEGARKGCPYRIDDFVGIPFTGIQLLVPKLLLGNAIAVKPPALHHSEAELHGYLRSQAEAWERDKRLKQ